MPSIKCGDTSVQSSAGHAKIAGDMRSRLVLFNEPTGVGYLTVTKDWESAAQAHAGGQALGVGVVNPCGFDPP